jgi:hypothetical protein
MEILLKKKLLDMKYACVLISVKVSSKHVARDENLANDARGIHTVLRVVFPSVLCNQKF